MHQLEPRHKEPASEVSLKKIVSERRLRRAKKRNAAIGSVLIALMACAIVFCTTGVLDGSGDASYFESESVLGETLKVRISASGEIVLKDKIAVYPRTAGIVTELYATVGDHVSKGDLLFCVQNDELEIACADAEEALASAQATNIEARQRFEDAEQKYRAEQERYQQQIEDYTKDVLNSTATVPNEGTGELPEQQGEDGLEEDDTAEAEEDIVDNEGVSGETAQEAVPREVVSEDSSLASLETASAQQQASYPSNFELQALGSAMATAESRYESAKLAEEQARLSLDSIRRQLDLCNVYCMADGTVLSIKAAVGDTVVPAADVMEIGDPRTAGAILGIGETDVRFVDVGQTVTVQLGTTSEKLSYNGVVDSVSIYPTYQSDSSSDTTLMYGVDVTLNEELERDIKPGMGVSASIVIGEYTDVMTVSDQAISWIDGDPFIYLCSDGQTGPRRIPVSVVASVDGRSVIEGDVGIGDEVAIGYKNDTEAVG